MKVLIISFYFPPYNNIAATRVGKTAKYLVRLGHEVRVLTAIDPLAGTGDRSAPVEIPEAHIVRTRWFGHLGKEALYAPASAAGASAAAQPPGHVVPGATPTDAAPGPKSRRRFPLPETALGWVPFALAASRRTVRAWTPDVMLASYSPGASLVIASVLARRLGIPWVAEFRDLWADSHLNRYSPLARKINDLAERGVLRNAAGLITVSESLAATLRRKYAKPVAVVLRGFDPEDYPDGAPSSAGQLRLVMTGRAYWHAQDPKPLFQGLSDLGPERGACRIYFYQQRRQKELYDAACACGVGDLVEFPGPVSYAESLRAQASADVLVNLLWNDPAQQGILSGKLFEYIGARRPILGVGHDPATAEFIAQRQLGVVARDASEVTTHLRAFLDQKRRGGIPGTAPAAMAGLSRQEQTAILADFLAEVITRPNR